MARVQLLAIHRRADSLYQSILGCDYTQTCGITTYRLGHLSKLLNIDEQKLINEHTVYPYFAYYMDEDLAKALYAAINGDLPASLECQTGSVNSRLGIPLYHSFCPLCADQDVKQHGVIYGHQAHALPGVSACHLHKCQLVRTLKQPKVLSSPDLNQVEICEASDAEILFSELSASLYRVIKPQETPSTIIEQYRQQLDHAGYITEAGYVRQQKLLLDIKIFWQGLLKLPDFKNLKTGGREHNFVRDVLNPEKKRTHPVKHILLSGFIKHCNPENPPLQIKDTSYPNRNKRVENEQLAIELLRNGTALHKAAKESGVSYYGIRKLAQKHSINRKSRKKKGNYSAPLKSIFGDNQ